MAQAPKQKEAAPQRNSFSFEQFQGVNTATVRAGVPEEQAYWLDGLMPLAPRNLRILPGVGPTIYNSGGPPNIVYFGWFNILAVPFAAVFQSDGSVVQVDLLGNHKTILPAGTIVNTPIEITNSGFSQYGQKYLIIVANQPNGYWLWDGNLIYTAGTLSPVVNMTNTGGGYVSQPNIIASGGEGSGATFEASISNGQITDITVTNPGTGYLAGDAPILTISGGNTAGSGATATAQIVNVPAGSGGVITLTFKTISLLERQLTSVTITNGGSGYSAVVKAVIDQGSGPGAHWGPNSSATASPPTLKITTTAGVITGVTLTADSFNPSNLWWFSSGSPTLPAVTVSDTGYFAVTAVVINTGGSNYGPNTKITATGGGTPQQQATITPVLSAGVVVGTTIVNGGIYLTNAAPTLTITDSLANATATISIMPFGIQGTAVETYQGRVWVLNGPVFNFTAPGSFSDFSTSGGGGSQQSSDSFLKVGYTAAVQTNGFLFIIGDSSMNYVSGVQTSASAVTTYTNNNSDPEQGTPYPCAVTTLGQDILMANSTGIFVSSGGVFQKRSEFLDGVYGSVPNFGGLQLSTAKATIFGKRVWMVLVPIVDPVTGALPQFTNNVTNVGDSTLFFDAVPAGVVPGTLVYDVTTPAAIQTGTPVQSVTDTTVTLDNIVLSPGVGRGDKIMFFEQKLLMFNGRQWWASSQDIPCVFIATQEINSVYTAWGTDGVSLFQLFAQPSGSFTKRAQTKFWDDPGYETNKTATRFWSLWQVYDESDTAFTLEVDATGLDENFNQFVNTASYNMIAQGASGTTAITIPQAVGQQGVLIGMTISTDAPDMALVSARLLPDLYQYRG
jgi:hypothetical protein